MRLRPIATVVLSLVCVALPRPAQAWLGDGWFERLSGPGPFRGFNLDLRLVCLTSPSDATRQERVDMLNESHNPIGRRGTWPKDADAGRWLTLFGCHFLQRDEPRLELGFQYARMSANGEDSLLDYSHRPGLTPQDKDVRLNSFMLTADLRVNRIVDLGAAIGRGSFSSPAGAFASFSRVVFQPVRVTLRPLSPIAPKSRFADAFMIRGDGTMFKDGFIDQDFGARPGSFREPGEIVWGWSLIFDASTLFWLN